MIQEGIFVRCPIDREYPKNPRMFATGKVISIDKFNETAKIKFEDPFGYRKYFDYIPDEVPEIPIEALDHCHLFKESIVKADFNTGRIVEYKKNEDGTFDYYIQDDNTKNYSCVNEVKIHASFFSGCPNPVNQLKHYEFQNPCWYLGRQVVKETMNVLDNSIFGFKELAGCKIYLKAFQLNTIMQCLQSETCRYMLADEVGLGKTIEACSILKIFLSNKSNQRVLIAVPNALVAQWRTELLFKFGIIEGLDRNSNQIILTEVEKLTATQCNRNWDFVVVDEVHNYLKKSDSYNKIHELSVNSKNIILLSATPIQQRKEEYLSLLRLIIPTQYDKMTSEEFAVLVEKQNRISRLTHSLLDELDSFKNELLPEVEGDPRENEDIQDELEEIEEILDDLSNIICDPTLRELIARVDYKSDDFGIYAIQVIVSYICDNYQIERNIIRGRRAILGVYPKDSDGEFAERRLEEIVYSIDEENCYYENDAYRTLTQWVLRHQETMTTEIVSKTIQPILESFFSSPWAYMDVLRKANLDDSDEVIKSAERWLQDENDVLENIADLLDDVAQHPSRLILLLNYIDENLFGKKVVLFTDHIETFQVYYRVFKDAFGDEVTGFGRLVPKEEAEVNIYRFQSDPNCKILICDQSGGEGRNLQIADYVIHIDLPWNINNIEQRIGRLDRMGRDVEKPVTSVVIHSENSYEEQLFKFWNEGLNVFNQSLSGLEIIMNDINQKIVDSIRTDFEYGLYRLIPDLIKEASDMRETVRREQVFDTAALMYRPLYIQLEKLLANYQFNENRLFAETMMSWASLAGFGALIHSSDSNMVSFNEHNFSVKSAQNSFLIPPNWDSYFDKKQNEMLIRIQRGIEVEENSRSYNDNRMIKGTFDRDTGIKNDYIHFYAPGDEIFDCIVENAMHSYKGMCSAFAAESTVEWKGFIYTYSIEPNERLLLDHGISLYVLGLFRQYLATSIQVVPVAFSTYSDIPEKQVLSEHKRLTQLGYFNETDSIDHLGRRGLSRGLLGISNRYRSSNADWFKGQYQDEHWEKLVDQSSGIARKRARTKFAKESDLRNAKEMISQLLSSYESRTKYFGISDSVDIDTLKRELEIVYESLEKPILRLESACFMWLVKK